MMMVVTPLVRGICISGGLSTDPRKQLKCPLECKQCQHRHDQGYPDRRAVAERLDGLGEQMRGSRRQQDADGNADYKRQGPAKPHLSAMQGEDRNRSQQLNAEHRNHRVR